MECFFDARLLSICDMHTYIQYMTFIIMFLAQNGMACVRSAKRRIIIIISILNFFFVIYKYTHRKIKHISRCRNSNIEQNKEILTKTICSVVTRPKSKHLYMYHQSFLLLSLHTYNIDQNRAW